MEDVVKQIATDASKRYSEGGPITLSFGLLLAYMIYNSWSQGKAQVAAQLMATEDRKRAEELMAAERKRVEDASAAERKVFMDHVEMFTRTISEHSSGMEAQTRAMERIGTEIGELGSRVKDFDGRLGRIEEARKR